MILVMIWIQGSGKWTQWKILKEKYGFNNYETGGTLRNMAKEDSELGRKIKDILEAGKHVSPEIVEDILIDIIEKNWKDGKIILDWFVRNQWNKKSVDKIIWDYQVLYFDLPEDEAIKRLCGRMYDPETGETFMSGTPTNPLSGAKLIKRADDDDEAIKQRIELFYKKTMPLAEEYKKEWKLIEVNANQSIEEVTKEMVEKLGL